MRKIFMNGNKIRIGWRIALLCIFIAIFSVIITISWKALGFPPQKSNGIINTTSFVVSGVLIFGVVLLSIYITMRFTETRKLNTVGLSTNHWKKNIFFGLFFGLLTPLLICIIYFMSGNAVVHINNDLSIKEILTTTLPFFVFFIFQSGFEELLFRGYGLQLFIEGVGKNFAVIITGLLFGLAHSSNPGADIIGLLNTSLNGALLAIIVINTGSIIMVWAYHASWNIFSSLVLGLNVSGIQLKSSFFNTEVHGMEWITGGKYGFEASVIAGPIETIILLSLIYLLKLYPIKDKGINYFQSNPENTKNHQQSANTK